MLEQLALAAPILALGAGLQTVAGFGIGLVAVPLLLWLGFSLPESVALLIGGGLAQTVYGSYTARRSIRWRQVIPLGMVQWLTLPLGVLLMRVALDGQQDRAKQLVGGMLMLILVVRLLVRPQPRQQVHPGWGWAAAGSAGLLAGLAGMGGPPLVLFAQAHQWSKDRFRGFLWAQFMIGSPVLVVALTAHAGLGLLWTFLTGLLLTPFTWAGTWLGLALTRRWDARRVQVAATILLFVLGLTSIIGPALP